LKGASRAASWRKRTGDHSATYQREWNHRRREVAIAHYGGKCACCGETMLEFLAIDHVNGGGDKQRLEVGSGSLFVNWLINHNFPEGYQVLCHNCNQAKGYYGQCPHERIFRVVNAFS
jgi:hypothetical protein